MNNPFDYIPTEACNEAFGRLLDRLEALKTSCHPEEASFLRELEEGKMLGVLIAADENGKQETLYAFSGQYGKAGFHFPGFVEPVFDYLNPEGYFKKEESEISRLNSEIDEFLKKSIAPLRQSYAAESERMETQIRNFKDRCRSSKSKRDTIREKGIMDASEAATLIRQSQFEKAELRRLKKRCKSELAPLKNKLETAEQRLNQLKRRRRAESEALQTWLFDNFHLLNAEGERKSLSEIFVGTAVKIPPSGAGECCAPKLLQAAYKKGLKPLAMAEYWYGKPKSGEVRRHGEYYPACRGKCLPILRWMLKGLCVEPPIDTERFGTENHPAPEIIYENDRFCVIYKPSGLLSVPGKGKAPSLQQWLNNRYGPRKEVKVAHRLDQDTSGLIIATFGYEAYKNIQALFARHEIVKTYIAVLEGDYKAMGIAHKGRIELSLSPDLLDRPRQRIDIENGKPAVTDYEFIDVRDGRSRITFRPLTGRTHQLRLHSASEQGLGMPIAGDRLYGYKDRQRPGRLLLHAQKIEFVYPEGGQKYKFEIEAPF